MARRRKSGGRSGGRFRDFYATKARRRAKLRERLEVGRGNRGDGFGKQRREALARSGGAPSFDHFGSPRPGRPGPPQQTSRQQQEEQFAFLQQRFPDLTNNVNIRFRDELAGGAAGNARANERLITLQSGQPPIQGEGGTYNADTIAHELGHVNSPEFIRNSRRARQYSELAGVEQGPNPEFDGKPYGHFLRSDKNAQGISALEQYAADFAANLGQNPLSYGTGRATSRERRLLLAGQGLLPPLQPSLAWRRRR